MNQDIIQTIIEAGKQRKTIIINYIELDGTGEGPREVEPYSFRPRDTMEKFFAWDIAKDGMRSFLTDRIKSAEITDRIFMPRYEIEF